MKLTNINGRPSALLAVCAPVSGVAGSLAVSPAAHPMVGRKAAWGEYATGASQLQAQRVRGRHVSANELAVKDSAKVETIFGDVRGVPPRGRPV